MSENAEARPTSTVANGQTGKRVNTVVSQSESKRFGLKYARIHTQCPHFNGGCIIPDLCRQRQIEICPVRKGWCQEINESDQEFQSFCLSHPAEA